MGSGENELAVFATKINRNVKYASTYCHCTCHNIATILAIIFVPLYIVERLLPGNALVLAAFTLTLAEGFLVLAFTFLQAIFSQILVLVSFKLTHEKPLIIQNESFEKRFYAGLSSSGFSCIF